MTEHTGNFIKDTWQRLTADEAMDLHQWQERIILAVFAAMLLFGLVPLYSSLKLSVDTGRWLHLGIHLGVYLLACVVAFARAIPLKVRAWLCVVLLFLLGVLSFFSLGPHGSGRIYMYTAAVLASLLLGLRASMVYLSLVIAFCAVFTYFLNTGKISVVLTDPESIVAWNTTIVTFLFLCVITCTALAVLIRGLSSALEKSRDLFESAPNAYFSLEMDGSISQCNRRASILLGHPTDKLTGHSIIEFFAGNASDRQKAQNILEKFQQGKEARGEELQMVKADGGTIWVSFTVNTMQDAQGRLSKGRAMVADITERKRIAHALSDSEQRFRQIFEESPVALFMQDFSVAKQGLQSLEASGITDLRAHLEMNPQELTDLHGKIKLLFVNRATTELYESGDRETMMSILRKLPSKEVRRNFLDLLLHLYQGGRRFSKSAKDQTFKNNQIEIVFSTVVMAGYEQDLSQVLTSIIDLSAFNKAQREKQSLENQLRQAQKMEAVGTLAGGIAHDFNNILAAVMGYAEIGLEKAKGGAPNAKELEGILQASRRAEKLVRQILTFSRRNESELRLIKVNEGIMATTNLLKQILPKMIDIQLELSDEAKPVMGDPNQIEQIILNLGTNARDAMPEGGTITITTSLQNVENMTGLPNAEPFSGEFVVIEVGDHGLGMTKEVQDRVFDPFFTTKEVGKGTGLGLAAAFGIVKSHNGHITCTSEVGKGTTFKIYLPAAREGHVPRADESGDLEAFKGNGETILLVDDEINILEINAHNLSQAGYTVVNAASGEEALRIFQADNQAIDLVIMDLSMPGMGGRKCMRELRGLSPELKVIVATGYSRDGGLNGTITFTASALLSKPISKNELLKTVRMVLDA